MTTPLDCREVCTFLYAYLDSELDSTTTLLVEEHLAVCPSCRERFTQFEKVREEIRHHVRKMPAPLSLKKQLRKTCSARSSCYPKIALGVAALLLLSLAGFYYGRGHGKAAVGHASITGTSVLPISTSAMGRVVHLEGTIVCLRCMMNEKHLGLEPCSKVGHAWALKTKDGKIWLMLPGKHLDAIIKNRNNPLHSHASLRGVIASTNQPVVDVASMKF